MKILFALLVTFFLGTIISAQINAQIITENKEGQIKLKAVASNPSDLYSDLNYIMVAVKKGKGGNSTNKQSGKFSLNPKETKTLSEMNINVSKNDGLKVFLFLKDEETDKVVSKDSLEINGKEFTSEISYIPENNLELTGLTIDETKTRIGQIFYDSFFKKYNQISQKFDGTIIISEMPTFGRNTRILLTIDDQLIHAFLSKPDEEAVEQEADNALADLIEYNSRNSLRNKEFKY